MRREKPGAAGRKLRAAGTAARAAKNTAQAGARTVKVLTASGPAGWIALAVIGLIGLVVLMWVYFNAAAGEFAPDVDARYDPPLHLGLTDGTPAAYQQLYETASAEWEIPWQILAAWGDVATSHGRYSPYDCVQRVDPDGLLGYTGYPAPELVDGYLAERHPDVPPGDRTLLGWAPPPEDDINVGAVCGPHGWLHQWCPGHTNLAPLAPDPPIAPPDEWNSDRHAPWRPDAPGYEFEAETSPDGETTAVFCFPPSGTPALVIEDGNHLCGPMLLNPAKTGVSCAELQNPAVAVDIAASAISRQIGNEIYWNELPTDARLSASLNGQDDRTNASVFHSRGVILFESEREAVKKYAESPLEVPYSSRTPAGRVLRTTAELFPAYWAVVLDKAIIAVSDAEMGRELSDCAGTLAGGFNPTGGNPDVFSRHAYCHLRAAAPAYHDARLAGYANEGAAVAELAARLWTEDLMRVSWVWNEWGNPRNTPEKPEPAGTAEPGGLVCRETTDETGLPLYAGVWLPFPAVTCDDIASWDATEPEEAAKRIQQRGWGGFAGYRRPPSDAAAAPGGGVGCAAPEPEVGETTHEDETTPEGVTLRTWSTTLTWEHTTPTAATDAGTGRCRPAGPLTSGAAPAELLVTPTPVITAEVGNTLISVTLTDAETPTRCVSASVDILEIVWECETEPITVGVTEHATRPGEPADGDAIRITGAARLGIPWWHPDPATDPFAEPDGCGNPYEPGTDPCDAEIIWPWMTAGWNCPDRPLGSRSLPSGHDYWPAARTQPRQACLCAWVRVLYMYM